jgi:hypothetical protein
MIWRKRMPGIINSRAVYSTLLLVILVGCATGKDASQTLAAPFELIWANAEPWVSGTSDGPSGMRVRFELTPPSATVRFKSLCYMQQSATVSRRPNRPDEFSVNYEYKPSSSQLQFKACAAPDFWQNETSQPDQAVLIYEQDGVENYFVIKDIVLKPVLAYPGRQ